MTVMSYAQASVQSSSSSTTHRVIVKFKQPVFDQRLTVDLNKATAADNTGLLSQNPQSVELRYIRTMANTAKVYQVDGAQIIAVTTALNQQNDIEYALIDERRYPATRPNDFNASTQWYLEHENAVPDSIGINAAEAWSLTNFNSNIDPVIIAVVDTGFTEHPDIHEAQLYVDGYDFIGADPDGSYTTANDGDGRDADPQDPGDWEPVDVCDNDTQNNSSWHGTLVSGIIGAGANNLPGTGTNIVGAIGNETNIKIQHLRSLGRCGGYISDIADAIRWAAGLPVIGLPINTTPVDVINLSLGATSQCSFIEQEAIDQAHAAGVLIVVSAGNDSHATRLNTPASCNNVIAVSATTTQGGQASYSNVGPVTDLSAPGGNGRFTGGNITRQGLITTGNFGETEPGRAGHVVVSGTSFSAPLVSAALAMLIDSRPDLDTESIYNALINNLSPFPAIANDAETVCVDQCGAGILNIHAALLSVLNGDTEPDPVPLPPAMPEPEPEPEPKPVVTPEEPDNTEPVEANRQGGSGVLSWWLLLGLVMYQRYCLKVRVAAN